MASEKKPVKGILKSSSSFDKEGQQSRSAPAEKEMKWDEMNILATYHPADKDYGHTKIDEPPTPYNRQYDGEEGGLSGPEDEAVDPQNLAASLAAGSLKPKIMAKPSSSEEEEDEEELTDEQKAKKREFIKRRKLHYNEFQAVRLARQLLENDDDEGADESVSRVTAGGDAPITEGALDDDSGATL